MTQLYADQTKNYKDWDYLTGNYAQNMSIAISRELHLRELNYLAGGELQLAVQGGGKFSKWTPYYKGFSREQLQTAYDIHRSVLENEIIVESDYPTYEENYESARVIGQMLEAKGFVPMYYFSGNKSIHIHLLLDFKGFLLVPNYLQEAVLGLFLTRSGFVKKFMAYLRERIISCWGTKIRVFDEQFVHPVHLVRSEMSRNKLGYKTFLGYTYKDIPSIPYICNETNRIYPKIGELRFSHPNLAQILEAFLDNYMRSRRVSKTKSRANTLHRYLSGSAKTQTIRKSVKYLLSEAFVSGDDGFKRALFIISNELKLCLGMEEGYKLLLDWNRRCNNRFTQEELKYCFSQKAYSLSDAYIDGFIDSLDHRLALDKCEDKI